MDRVATLVGSEKERTTSSEFSRSRSTVARPIAEAPPAGYREWDTKPAPFRFLGKEDPLQAIRAFTAAPTRSACPPSASTETAKLQGRNSNNACSVDSREVSRKSHDRRIFPPSRSVPIGRTLVVLVAFLLAHASSG